MMNKILWLVSVGLVGTALHANSASFDCGKAKSFAEKTVCSDPNLSKRDDDLKYVFGMAKASVQDRKAFSEITKSLWNSRERCSDLTCVSAWYDSALAIYGAITEKGIPETDGTNDIIRNSRSTINNQTEAKPLNGTDKKNHSELYFEKYECMDSRDGNLVLVTDYINRFVIFTKRGEKLNSEIITRQANGSRTGISRDSTVSYVAGDGNNYTINYNGYSITATGCKESKN